MSKYSTDSFNRLPCKITLLSLLAHLWGVYVSFNKVQFEINFNNQINKFCTFFSVKLRFFYKNISFCAIFRMEQSLKSLKILLSHAKFELQTAFCQFSDLTSVKLWYPPTCTMLPTIKFGEKMHDNT